MNLEVRTITPDEYLAFNRVTQAAFGEQETDEEINEYRDVLEFDRTSAAVVDGQIAGTGALFSYDLTVPGGLTVRAGGVSWIGVLPTHRRRGVLSAIMRHQFENVRERGEPVTILWASESIIYGRFGYGMSTDQYWSEIDPRYGALAWSPAHRGRVRLANKDEAADILPGVYERFRVQQPGAIARDAVYWKHRLRDRENHRQGYSPLFFVLYEGESGGVDGYGMYRVKGEWTEGFARNHLRIVDFPTLTPAAYAALWEYFLQIDLIGAIECITSPEPPLRHMLADPRRLRVKSASDGLWTRIVNIPAALTARRYRLADELVFAVTDRFLPANSGCFRLTAGPDGAECTPVAAEADLVLEINDLGAAYLGGRQFTTLARAGRVEERTPGALRRADLMFGGDIPPMCTTGF